MSIRTQDAPLPEGRGSFSTRTVPTTSTRRLASGRCVLACGQTELEVDPALGGRITRFSHGGTDILAGPSHHEMYFGSTFWTSPESDWNQPPPAALDSEPYEVEPGSGPVISMVSVGDSCFANKQVKVRKTFSIDPVAGAFDVTYEIINTGDAFAFRLAPWEVTRLPGGGLSFFAYAETVRATDGITVNVIDNVAWFEHKTAVASGGQKIWLDSSEGWIAHVTGDLVYIKAFPLLLAGQAAPGESEVEIYSSNQASDPKAYVELEAQGAFDEIAPGGRSSWTVRWYLLPLPPHISAGVGSDALVHFVRQSLQRR